MIRSEWAQRQRRGISGGLAPDNSARRPRKPCREQEVLIVVTEIYPHYPLQWKNWGLWGLFFVC